MNESKFLKDFLNTVVKYLIVLMVVALVLFMLSGITFIKTDEVALILRFGKLVGETQDEQIREPGLCLAFPRIIDEIVRVPVGKVNEITLNTLYTDSEIVDVTKNGYALTGDNNVVRTQVVIKYKISNPVDYSLYANNIPETIQGIVSENLTNQICVMNVDSVLTDMKRNLADTVLAKSQETLDKTGAGVSIENIEIVTIQPPVEVVQYFDQVTSAFVEKETLVQEANQYKKSMIPKANSDYNDLITEAESYQYNIVTTARQDVTEFYGLIEEYRLNPEVTKERVYRDKVAAILTKIGTKLVLPEGEETPNINLN